jgi:hypothetical protein
MVLNLKYYKPCVFIPFVGVTWAISSWCLSKFWGYGLLQGLGPTAVIGILLYVYDRWLWKLPVFGLGNTMPKLYEEYSGEVEYDFNGTSGKKACVLNVKQTCSLIKVTCQFDKQKESSTQSTSYDAFITNDEHGDYRLCIYYHNKGSGRNGDTLEQHDGMNILDIKDSNIILNGYYFTNRSPQTRGIMNLKRIEKE